MIAIARFTLLGNRIIQVLCHFGCGALIFILFSCSHMSDTSKQFEYLLDPATVNETGPVLAVTIGNREPVCSLSDSESEAIYGAILWDTSWVYGYAVFTEDGCPMCPDDVDPSTPEFLPRLTKEDNTFVLHFYLYNPRTGIEEWVAKGTWRDGVSANYVNYRHFQVENVDAYRNGNKSTIVCNGRIIKMGQYGGKESVFEGGGRPAKSDFDFGG